MKKLIIALAILSLSGCGWFDRVTATATGNATTCIEGVRYIQFTSGASVMYDAQTKTIKTC